MVADLTITTRVSDNLYQLLSPTSRLWNEYARRALKTVLEYHHEHRIPLHFQLGARGRYQYARRRLATERKKIKVWKVPPNLDLVRSGRTARRVKQAFNVSFRGSYLGTLEGRLNMYLPYPFKKAKTGNIDFQEISNEITRVTQPEAEEMGRQFLFELTQQIRAFHGPMRFLRKTGSARAGTRSVSMLTKGGRRIGSVPGGGQQFSPGSYGPGF